MIKPDHLKQVEQRHPNTNDLLRGWNDAEIGIPYSRNETSDWQMGWTLWHHEHGGRIVTNSRH